MRSGAWREPPWFDFPAHRMRFLAELAPYVSRLRPQKATAQRRGGFAAAFVLAPTGIEARRTIVEFGRGDPEAPVVFVDGPKDSPHRFADGSLCMWHPRVPPDERWRRRNGAGVLAGQIAAHLIREEWYRQTGMWAGEEFPHGADHREESAA